MITSAEVDLRKKMKRVGQRVIKMFDKVQGYEVPDNEGGIQVNKSYLYLISAFQMMQMSDELETIIGEELPPDTVNPFVASAFNLGTTQAIANLANQTALPYDATQKIMSPAHQARIAIVQNRVFEQMQNLNADMKANLNRVLTDGMLNGENPRDVARRIRDQIGIPEWNSGDNQASYARAQRIARTEMGTAHREAIKAQDQDANDLGIKTKMIWFSALKPTTRKSHARKHGHLFTRDEISSFYSRDGNAINCFCSQQSVVLDEEGNPDNPEFVNRIKKVGDEFFKD
ncbi:MAG: phage minor head protein [Marinomonas gallaica]